MRHFGISLIFFFSLGATAQSVPLSERALPGIKNLFSSRLNSLNCTATAGLPEDEPSAGLRNVVRTIIQQAPRAAADRTERSIVFSNVTGSQTVTLLLTADEADIESAELVRRHVLEGTVVARVYCE